MTYSSIRYCLIGASISVENFTTRCMKTRSSCAGPDNSALKPKLRVLRDLGGKRSVRNACAARHFAGVSSGVLAFFDEHFPVHHRHLDAFRELLTPPGTSRQIVSLARFQRRDARRIEYHQVRGHSLPNQTAVIQAEE